MTGAMTGAMSAAVTGALPPWRSPSAGLRLIFALTASVALAPPLRAGEVEVIDGDTILVSGEPVRLLGIEAPDPGASCSRDGQSYPCGQEAARVLRQLIAGAEVRCDGLEGPRFGDVIVASCKADGRDLAGELVRRGWARADRRYASRYEHEEERARAAKLGLWAGTTPWP